MKVSYYSLSDSQKIAVDCIKNNIHNRGNFYTEEYLYYGAFLVFYLYFDSVHMSTKMFMIARDGHLFYLVK